jgi:superfamily I DNA/RNA helicase
VTVWAVDAAAGYGKTFRLMHMLEQDLVQQPLGDGQRVLALTFMHGSRRRLDERLRSVPGLGGRYTSITVDSLAWRLRVRWRSLGHWIGLPPPGGKGLSYEEECELAAVLLQQNDVQRWLAASFPVVLVDEAQDLTKPRLEMVVGLSQCVRLFLAADEFQCLVPTLRPNPLALWLPTVCKPESLPKPQRTNVAALLDAASAIRAGAAPVPSGKFRICEAPSVHLAAAVLASSIKWNGGESVAVITPSTKGAFVVDAINRVQSGPCGKNKDLGPYTIRWEESERDESARVDEALTLPDHCSVDAALAALAAMGRSGPVSQTMEWLKRMRNTTGRVDTTATEVRERLKLFLKLRRHHSGRSTARFLAMTVHQAKNREFDGVVVMWPYQLKGDSDSKRRLLYNAVTRAKRWCTVIVQSKKLLEAPPFT